MQMFLSFIPFHPGKCPSSAVTCHGSLNPRPSRRTIVTLHLINQYCRFGSKLHLLKSKLLYDWRSVCLGIEHLCRNYDQILFPVGVLLSETCGLISVRRHLWREDGSSICSVITRWSESRRILNHTVLSHLRFPPPRRVRFPYLYPPGTGWPSYTPGHWVPCTSSLATRLWRLAGPHRDRTTNPRPKLLKRKQYLVIRPQSGLATKTYCQP
jgi:hypothetical protein